MGKTWGTILVGISYLLAVATTFTGSGNLFCQWELYPGSGNALVLSLEQTKTNQAAKIEKLKKRVKKLKGEKKKRTHGLKRLYKVGLSARIVSSDKEDLGDQEDASKHERSIADIDQDKGTTLVDDTQGRMNKEDLFGVHDLSGDEVFVDVTTGENIEQDETVAEKEISTDGEVVIDAEDVEAKDKGNGIMIEHEKPLKMKDQIALDEEVTKNLESEMKAKMEEEERIAKEKEEANIAMINEWDNTHAMMDTDCKLAVKLQDEEKGELTIKEKSKLFVELMNKRKKHFERLRAKGRRRKPSTEA
nr:hypothetical protein [Tanacetum cinerariifolium]